MDSTPSQPQQTQIPDLVKIGSVSTDTAINVQTDILDPVIFSETQARFVLENKGILHSNSRITFSTEGDAFAGADLGRAFFPANVGINSVIQRASLRVGTKTISEIEDFAHFAAYESTFLPPDAVKEREQVMSGKFLSVKPTLLNRSKPLNVGNLTVNLTESLTESESIGIDTNTEPALTDPKAKYYDPILQDADPIATGIICDWQDESNKPTYSVLLADLFPFLKMNQLPLFMMSEQVSIHLTFQTKQADADANKSVRISKTRAADLDKDITLNRNDCQMVADYLFYPQDMMEQYRQANANMSFQYVDYQFVKRTVAAAEYQSGLIQNIGGAGRVVNKVFVMSHFQNTNPSNHLLNDYVAEGPTVDATSTGTVTTNLKYNDNFLYPIDVQNDARHYHNVFISEGRVPYITRDAYRGEGLLASKNASVAGSEDFEGHSMEESLRTKQFYTAYRLNKGERVNSRGIELYDTRTPLANARTMRVYLQVVKVASLKDGVFNVAFA